MDLDVAFEKEFQRKMDVLNDFLVKQLEFCKPPIKGEPTTGKLKWRGIAVVSQEMHNSTKKEYYLVQRCIKIGESIIF